MKIAIVGSGALGGYYGACLARSGEEVHFLFRSDYEVVRQRGLRVFSTEQGFDYTFQPRIARDPSEIGPCDCVVIGLKTTANAEFKSLLPPLVGGHTTLATLQNGLGNEDDIASLFPEQDILGGLCFVCINRIEPGVIHHIAHGRIVLGEFSPRLDSRRAALAQAFRAAGVPCDETPNLTQARWEKLVWNIPFNGLGVASAAGLDGLLEQRLPDALMPCLTTDQLLASRDWERLVRELMRETIQITRALGCPLDESVEEAQVQRTRSMGAYRSSSLIDFEQGRPLELESLFLRPHRVAEEHGVATPRLAALCGTLKLLEARNRLRRAAHAPTLQTP